MRHFLFNSKAKRVPKNFAKMTDVVNVNKGEYDNVKHVRLFGGDGTINNFINNHDVKTVTLHKYGSGNDLFRSINNQANTFIYNANDLKFINSFGYGIDSYVCSVAEESTTKSYFSILIKALKSFKCFDLEVTLDEEKYSFTDCYTISICNGQYFGGGIKIAPKANLEDEELDVVIVHNLHGLKLIIALFLLVFRKHYLLKKNVFYTKATNITIFNNQPITFQLDGEVRTTSTNIEISKNKAIKVIKSKKKF